MQLLQVVHQREELPLRIEFTSGSQRAAAQAVGVQVSEDRLDDAQAAVVQQTSLPGADAGFHRGGLRVRIASLGADNKLE